MILWNVKLIWVARLSLENYQLNFVTRRKRVYVTIIYPLHPIKKNESWRFLQNVSEFIDAFAINSRHLLILCDFNKNWCCQGLTFSDQQILGSICQNSHMDTLDLVISHDFDCLIRKWLCLLCCLIIAFIVINEYIKKQSIWAKVTSYRKHRSFNKDLFLGNTGSRSARLY